jgi:glycosyltransferase involved in cell wall biosynthesis
VLRIYPTANDLRHRRRELALRRLGVEIAVVAPYEYGCDWAPTPIEPELPHWRSRLLNKNSIPFHIWDPRALRRAVLEYDPELVDIHEDCYFPAAAQAVLAAAGRPVTMFAAQNIPKRHPLPIRRLRSWVFRRVAAFYACSAQAADVLRQWGYQSRIEVIPYGVEDELFQVRPGGERVGFVGSLVPQKGLADLLPFGSRLLCVGSGPLADQVRAAGGEVALARSPEELAGQLERMGVLVMPSRTLPGLKEQFGRAAVEAMAAGVPVVAYDSGALPEVIGDAGVIVPEGDRKELMRTVESVLETPDSLAQRGRARAWERYRWPRVAEQMLALYQKALAA